MAAGSIVIDLLMKTGSFETDTKRAEKALEQFNKRAAAAGKALGTAVAAGAVAAVAAFDQLNKAAADFKDLEEVTGASAEGLASFAVAAGTAGVEVDTIAGNMVRLTKNLSGVDDESKAAGAALKALGLNVAEFKQLDPVAQFDALTKAFGQFEDGSQKAAVATALFGKQGAELLKLFKALEEQGGRTTILTQQQIELADAYADAQARTTAELKLYAQAAATQALPAFNALTEAGKEFLAELAGIDTETDKLTDSGESIKTFAAGAARALGFLVDAGDGVVRVFQSAGTALGALLAVDAAISAGEFGRIKGIISEAGKDIDAVLTRTLFSTKLEEKLAQIGNVTRPDAQEAFRRGELGGGKPRLQFDGAVKADKKAKKPGDSGLALDRQEAFRLAELEAQAAVEQALATSKLEVAEKTRADNLKKLNEQQERLKDLLEATPSGKVEKELQAQRDDMILLAQAYEAGTISASKYFEAVDARLNGVPDDLKKTDDIARELGLTFSSAFEDAIVGGEGLSDVVNGLTQDVVRLLTRLLVVQPLAESVADIVKGIGKGGGGGGGFAAAIGAIGSAIFGNPSSSIGYENSFDRATPLAQGTDFVPFDNFPALLHKGERVVPRAFNPAAGGEGASGGNTYVTVENYGEQPATVQRSRQGNDEFVRVVVGIVADDMLAGGKSAGAVQRITGAQRQVVRRGT